VDLFARGFKFDQDYNYVTEVLDDKTIENVKMGNGSIKFNLMLSYSICNWRHSIEIVQKGRGNQISAVGSFLKAII
jgi:phage-related protein